VSRAGARAEAAPTSAALRSPETSLDLNFTAEELAFAAEVRAFAQRALPDDIRASVLGGEHVEAEHLARWQKIIHAQGWGAPTWPLSGAARAGTRSASTSSTRSAWSPVRRACCRSACAWSARC
jgi:hypothetical protein